MITNNKPEIAVLQFDEKTGIVHLFLTFLKLIINKNEKRSCKIQSNFICHRIIFQSSIFTVTSFFIGCCSNATLKGKFGENPALSP